MPEVLAIAIYSIGAWEILRRTFRWLAHHEEDRYQRWCDAYDPSERQWTRRIEHLHVIDGDLNGSLSGAQRRVHVPSQRNRGPA